VSVVAEHPAHRVANAAPIDAGLSMELACCFLWEFNRHTPMEDNTDSGTLLTSDPTTSQVLLGLERPFPVASPLTSRDAVSGDDIVDT